MKQPAIFLDRDGVINRNRPDHVKAWDEFEFLPGVLAALARLAGVGLPVLVISNQGAIGRIDDVLYCPHRPEDGCACRKPRPGLLLQAAERWDLDLAASVLVGDAEADILAAQRAGCRPLLVLTGRGAEQLAALRAAGRDGFLVAGDLPAAVDRIRSFLQPDAAPQPAPE